MKLQNKVYDVAKWIVMIVIPALGVLYATLAAVWGWPYAEQISKTCNAVTTALGIILGISTLNYNKETGAK